MKKFPACSNSLARCRERVRVRDLVWRNCLVRHTSDASQKTKVRACPPSTLLADMLEYRDKRSDDLQAYSDSGGGNGGMDPDRAVDRLRAARIGEGNAALGVGERRSFQSGGGLRKLPRDRGGNGKERTRDGIHGPLLVRDVHQRRRPAPEAAVATHRTISDVLISK